VCTVYVTMWVCNCTGVFTVLYGIYIVVFMASGFGYFVRNLFTLEHSFTNNVRK